jgi:hypothetical protein
MGAISSCVEDHIAEYKDHVTEVNDDIALIRNQVKSFIDDRVAGASLPSVHAHLASICYPGI